MRIKNREENNGKYLIGWGHVVNGVWGGGNPEMAWHLGLAWLFILHFWKSEAYTGTQKWSVFQFAGTNITMGFSRQEYWSGLPLPSPGDLPEPGIEPGSPAL